MEYCPACQLLCEGRCPQCGGRIRLPLENDPVYLGTASQQEVFWAEEVLKEEGIPYSKVGNLGAALTIRRGTKGETYRFYVPYGAYNRSRALMEELFVSLREEERTQEKN